MVSLRGTARYIRLSDAYLPPSLSHIKQESSVYKNDYLQRSVIPWNKKGPTGKVSGKTGHLLLVLLLLSLFTADWCGMSLATSFLTKGESQNDYVGTNKVISTHHPSYWKSHLVGNAFLTSVGTSHPTIIYTWGHFVLVTLVKMPNAEAHHDPLGYRCLLHFSTLAEGLPGSFRGKQF